MQRFGSQVTDKHVWEMIDEADMDGDSQINYDEFVRIMGGTSSQPNAFVTKMASSKRQQPQSAAPMRYARAEPAMAAVVTVAAEMGARSRSAPASGSGLQLRWKSRVNADKPDREQSIIFHYGSGVAVPVAVVSEKDGFTTGRQIPPPALAFVCCTP